jgi:hypothetical protein
VKGVQLPDHGVIAGHDDVGIRSLDYRLQRSEGVNRTIWVQVFDTGKKS